MCSIHPAPAEQLASSNCCSFQTSIFEADCFSTIVAKGFPLCLFVLQHTKWWCPMHLADQIARSRRDSHLQVSPEKSRTRTENKRRVLLQWALPGDNLQRRGTLRSSLFKEIDVTFYSWPQWCKADQWRWNHWQHEKESLHSRPGKLHCGNKHQEWRILVWQLEGKMFSFVITCNFNGYKVDFPKPHEECQGSKLSWIQAQTWTEVVWNDKCCAAYSLVRDGTRTKVLLNASSKWQS